MTHTPMADLKEFHDKFSPDGPARLESNITLDLLKKRRNLIREEFTETLDELDLLCRILAFPEEYTDDSLVNTVNNLAKELADLLYVVYGTAEELSIPLEKVFKIVHESNMAKLWPDGQVHYNEFGKVIKPPTYTPPDLSSIHD